MGLPSPKPLSGSLLVTETSVIFGFGSPMSKAVTVAFTSTYSWFGGHNELGVTVAFIWGGVVSPTIMLTLSVALSWPSDTVGVTVVFPPGKSAVGVTPEAEPPVQFQL